ncbi:hypothetical protein JD844_023047 [Phrynosoma platyrhinos]|uniref:Small membrane A-kinase anchor protein n=1 Tax=Phrynosoma platyrhinos TaxID=52577 RepID=A0ABQ7SW24_PHRPL|nr:hypothetical protein JD844_023047 [Phrynosoma platyrhinos]
MTVYKNERQLIVEIGQKLSSVIELYNIPQSDCDNILGEIRAFDDGSREITGYDSEGNIEKSSFIQANAGMSASANTVVVDFAHRLSLEILDQAVKQWAVTESKYSDIPFIESDEP